MADSDNPDSAAEEKPNRVMTSHFPLLLALLIAASVWIYVFTSWFPIFGSILGLGGVLMVVPTLQGLMSAERRKSYADWIDNLLFQNPLSAKVYIILLAVGLFAGFIVFQPLTLTNHLVDRSLQIRVGLSQTASDKPPTRRVLIAPGESYSLPFLQPFLGGPKYVWVSSPGHPQIKKKVFGLGWPSMSMPEDLWQQPIILFRPRSDLFNPLLDAFPTFKVTVTPARNTAQAVRKCDMAKNYIGQPIWFGGGNLDLALPKDRVERWIREYALMKVAQGIETTATTVLETSIRPDCPINFTDLASGDRIDWSLIGKNSGQVLSRGSLTIDADMAFPFEVSMPPLEETSQ